MKDNLSSRSNEIFDLFPKQSPQKSNNNNLYFEENDQSYKRDHQSSQGRGEGRRKVSQQERNYSYANNPINSYKRKDYFDYKKGLPPGNSSNSYENKYTNQSNQSNQYKKENFQRNTDYKDDSYYRRSQIPSNYMHHNQNPDYYSYQKRDYNRNAFDQDVRKKEKSRSRSRSFEMKRNKNNFPIICNINRSFFKSFDDHFHEIKREITEKVSNLDEFRLKNFRETPESYILIDSFSFLAARKAFKIYLEKTYDYLIGLFQKVSFLKICVLVPNRKSNIRLIIN